MSKDAVAEGAGMSRAAKRRRKEGRSAPPHTRAPVDATSECAPTGERSKPRARKSRGADEAAVSMSVQRLMGAGEEEMTATGKAALLFAHLVHPLAPEEFHAEYWETQPVRLQSETASFESLFPSSALQSIIREHLLVAGVHARVSSYSDFIEYNSDGSFVKYGEEASAPEVSYDQARVRAALRDGYSLCLLAPHAFDDSLWRYLSLLELHLSLAVTSRVFHVPGMRAPTAPTCEMANVFFVQLAGSSSWTIHKPSVVDSNADELLLFGSVVNGKALSAIPPDMELSLSANDVLYVPRGWVHAMRNDAAEPCTVLLLEIAGTSMADLLDTLIPQALAERISKSEALRRSVPAEFTRVFGVAQSEDTHDARTHIEQGVRGALEGLVGEALDLLDAAADQVAKGFIVDRLPVPLSAAEERRCFAGAPDARIAPYTRLRMLRPGVARAVVENQACMVYHCMDNSRHRHGNPVSPLEFELDDGPALEALLDSYPEGVVVSDLPHPSEEEDDKLSVAAALYKEGFLVVLDESTIPFSEDEGSDEDNPF